MLCLSKIYYYTKARNIFSKSYETILSEFQNEKQTMSSTFQTLPKNLEH